MELIGSIILPAATGCTVYLIVNTFVSNDPQLIPLLMLAAILGLPAVLILFTIRRFIYFFWFVVYLIALPVWQVVLPLYAFWHFDDFTWGETRQVSGEEGKKAGDHSRHEGEFDSKGINLKPWAEWVRERAFMEERRKRDLYLQQTQQLQSRPTMPPPASANWLFSSPPHPRPMMSMTLPHRPPSHTFHQPPGTFTLRPPNSMAGDGRMSMAWGPLPSFTGTMPLGTPPSNWRPIAAPSPPFATPMAGGYITPVQMARSRSESSKGSRSASHNYPMRDVESYDPIAKQKYENPLSETEAVPKEQTAVDADASETASNGI